MSLYDTTSIVQAGRKFLASKARLAGQWDRTYGSGAPPPDVALTRAAILGTTIEEQITALACRRGAK